METNYETQYQYEQGVAAISAAQDGRGAFEKKMFGCSDKNFVTRPNIFPRSLVITVAIQLCRVVLRARHAFGVPGVRVPRQSFRHHIPVSSLRHLHGGVLAVLAGSIAVSFSNRPEEPLRTK